MSDIESDQADEYLEARPCAENGEFLPDNAPPPPMREHSPSDYGPFESRTQFEIGDFLYRRAQMSGAKIDELMQLWSSTLHEGVEPPFASHGHLYDTIDNIALGEAPWNSFTVRYSGVMPDGPPPPWMVCDYEVHFQSPLTVLRNQISNPDFSSDVDYAPQRIFGPDGKRIFKDFMSGDWAWNEAVHIEFTYLICIGN